MFLFQHGKRAELSGLGDKILGDVAGAQQHRQVWPDGAHRLDDIQAGTCGHVEVGDQDVKGIGVPAHDGEGHVGVREARHRVAGALQQPLDHHCHHRVVVDVHHAFTAHRHRHGPVHRGRRGGWRCMDAWQVDVEPASRAELRRQGDGTFVGLDDAVHHRQPESGTATDRLGREEGFEDAALRVLAHAAAVVCHPQVGMRAGSEPQFHRAGRGQLHHRETDTDAAAKRSHRLRGVGAQIQHDLLDLRGIGHRADCIEFCSHRDVRRQRRVQQTDPFGDDLAQGAYLPCGCLLTAEGKDLLDQIACAHTGLVDVLHAPHGVGVGVLLDRVEHQ